MENAETRIQFNFHSFKVHEFALIGNSYTNGEELQLTTSIDIVADSDNKRVGFIMVFEFFQLEKHLLKLKTGCYIELDNESWNKFVIIGTKFENGYLITLPDKMLKYFINFTIDTSRGILIAKTEGTLFASLMLPIVNVEEIAISMEKRANELLNSNQEITQLSDSSKKTPKLKKPKK